MVGKHTQVVLINRCKHMREGVRRIMMMRKRRVKVTPLIKIVMKARRGTSMIVTNF